MATSSNTSAFTLRPRGQHNTVGSKPIEMVIFKEKIKFGLKAMTTVENKLKNGDNASYTASIAINKSF